MEHEGPQAKSGFRQIGDVRAVNSSAHTNDAIVLPIAAVAFDPLDDRCYFASTSFIRMPVRQNVLVEVIAVVAPAPRVERYIGVRGIHNAVRAHAVWPMRTRCSFDRLFKNARHAELDSFGYGARGAAFSECCW